jgi:amino acid permease
MSRRSINAYTDRAAEAPFKFGEALTPVLAFANAALGAGVLAYPFAYSGSGLAVGPALTLSIGSLAFASLCVIMRVTACVQETRPHIGTYGGVVTEIVGSGAGRLVEAICLCYCFAGTISYTVLVGDQNSLLLEVFKMTHSGQSPAEQDAASDRARLYLVAVATCCGFLLNLLRRVSALRYTAFLLVASVLFTVGMLLAQAIRKPCWRGHCFDELDPPEGPRDGWPQDAPTPAISAWPVGLQGVLRALPLFAFANQCHLQCPYIFSEMPQHVRNSPTRRALIAAAAILLIVSIYFCAGISGFVRFGQATQGDVLTNFSDTDLPAILARAGITIVGICSIPMQHFPARRTLHSLFTGCCRRCGGSGASSYSSGEARATSLLDDQDLVSDGGSAAGGVVSSTDAKPAASGGASGTLSHISFRFIFIESLLWSLSTGTVAHLVGKQIKVVFGLIGALGASSVIFLVPSAMWWCQPGWRGRRSMGRLLPTILLGATGAFVTVAGTLFTLEDALNHPPSPPPPPLPAPAAAIFFS